MATVANLIAKAICSDGRTGILSPGQAMVVPYHLAGPGRYLLACFLPDPGSHGQGHEMLGMTKVIDVR